MGIFNQNKESGETLMSAMVACALFLLVIVAGLHLMSNYQNANFKAVELGGEEDMRNYIRRILDCDKTMARESAICTTGGRIRGYDVNDRPLMRDPGRGIQFGTSNVKINCAKDNQGFNITAEVNHRGLPAKELFDVPLTCQQGCGYNPSAPDPYTISGGPWAVRAAVNAEALKCGLSFPNLPFRKSFTSSGGGNRWTSYGADDLVTLNELCSILGFTNYVSSTCLDMERSGRYPNGKCNFHSPGNNNILYYSGAAWVNHRGPPKYNWIWVASLTCSGKR